MKKTFNIFIAGFLMTSCFSGCGGQASEVPEFSNTVHSVEDLNGKKIGTQLGTTGCSLAGSISNARVEEYNKGAAAVQALSQGKLDAVIIDSEPAKALIENYDDLKILSDPFAVEEYSIAYKKGNNELGEQLNAAIDIIKSDGTLDSIISHWIGDSADKVSYVPYSSAEHSNGTLVMATNAEFPPYESIENDNVVGIDIDMMNALCEVMGMELVVENMEFDSIFAAVDSGKADVGVAGISITPEREKKLEFTQSYETTTQVIIVRKD